MTNAHDPSPLRRHPANPILTYADMPVESWAVFNAGATRFGDKVLLILRVEDYERHSHFHVATSVDGIHFEVNPEEIDYPLRDIERELGSTRFDMRITSLDNTFYCYHCVWLHGVGSTIALARTEDFVHFEAIGGTSTTANRNAVLFPEKIGGRYCRFERPEASKNTIWVSYSPDLVHWGDSKPMLFPETAWNFEKIGASTIPVRTEHGWLEIYHGVASPPDFSNYFLGVALLDFEDPTRIIATPRKFILAPQMEYEGRGQYPNVIFTSGAALTDDGRYLVYYGAADTVMCMAEANLDDLIDAAKNR